VLVSEFWFDLPETAIATSPAKPRDSSRLLVHDRARGTAETRVFRELPDLLRAGDLLVVNDTRVLPHRLVGRRASGGRVECLVLARSGSSCAGLFRPAKRLRRGELVALEEGALVARIVRELGEGGLEFELSAPGGDLESALRTHGRAPLPPYLSRNGEDDDRRREDLASYQTVFAKRDGAVAAPTAGLHFTPGLIEALERRGILLASVTLHVGLGTFEPIRVERVEDHRMHAESFEIGPAAADLLHEARSRGGRVVAVGTTVARVLETVAAPDGRAVPCRGSTALFIHPGYRFRAVDALLTNFHLPGSTLLLLVSALVGREKLLELYGRAIREGYRFYSFGDAMLVL
jgi:S-adenosylmethionine:tRNA ribosyltransferase-isomerase